MKNLFIMHTQYNLILSSAVISRNSQDTNTLVLYSEFCVTEDMTTSLSKVFDKVIIVRENFETLKKPVEEMLYVRKLLKKIKCIRKEFFDCVYMSQERVFERVLLAMARKNNPKLKCCDIEEDAYYSINNKFNDNDFVLNITFKQKVKDYLLSLLLVGYPYNYKERVYCYGMSSEYDAANLLFPWLCRRELDGKELNEITANELLQGIESLYHERNFKYPDSQRYVVMFFDLINRYKKRNVIENIVKQISDICNENGIAMIVKYHPRETEKFYDIGQVYEIDHIIPAEKILKDLYGRKVIVFGNATTSCVVAAKLGYNVISVAKLETPDNTRLHQVFEAMGITCVENDDDVEKNIMQILGR